MDREIAPELIRSQKHRRLVMGAAIILIIILAVYLFNRSLGTSVESSRIRIATVETGDVDNTITASGEIMPAYEQILTSPIKASIKQVLFTPGTRLKPGQQILTLDKSYTEIELEKMQDQLALKQNSIEQLRMRLNKDLKDVEINDQIKLLNINRLRADFEDTKRLQKVGGRTGEDVTRAENALKIAELEKKQLENTLAYNRQSMGASLRETELSAQIEVKNLKELRHKLQLADISSDRAGVLTWINENIGSAINEGDMLAKIADLGSFRVDGYCSDAYADQVKTGMPVIVKFNESRLNGFITQVKPSIQNGIIEFVIQLDNAKNDSLRPNMKVEVFVVTDRHAGTLRVANGPAFTGKPVQYVFVVNDRIASRKEVEVGLSNFDFVEIKKGLAPGDKIIVSNMNDFENLKEVSIK